MQRKYYVLKFKIRNTHCIYRYYIVMQTINDYDDNNLVLFIIIITIQ